jgi:outer membrane receptor protein involved in Fe transport
LGKQPGFAQVDLTAGVERDNWHAEVFVENAFDERGDLFNFPLCTTQVCEHQVYTTPITPRMIGIKFGQKF